MIKLNIKAKLTLLISAVIIAVSLSLGLFLLFATEQKMLQAFKQQGLLLADTLAYNSRYAVFSEDSVLLETIMDGLFRAESVHYAVISNQAGVVLAKRSLVPGDLILTSLPLYGDKSKPQVTSLRIGGPASFTSQPFSYYDFAAVVASLEHPVPFPEDLTEGSRGSTHSDLQPLGVIHIGLSTQKLDSEIRRFIHLGLWITGFLLACGILLSYYISLYYTRPIANLAAITSGVFKGDFSQRASVKSDDEIGALAVSFNAMSAQVSERTLSLADANKALQKSYERLEERVAERTAELSAMNEELESFTYTVSHDLRAPIRALLGYAHILLEDHADRFNDEGRRLMSVLQEQSTHIGNLIDDLLNFSHLGRSEINRSHIDMNDLVSKVVKQLRALEPARGVTVTVSDLPPLIADPILLQQVFINLIGNAFKYTSKNKEAVVTIGCNMGEKVDKEWVCYVADNGVGFDMQYMGKLFGVFQRLHTVDEFPGTGVGLAIVQRIIERHGGRVWAESTLGEGAKFYMALPNDTLL
jgi:signal transduction histidine kinase